MDSASQKAGEGLVRAVLVEPLLRRGLARPSGMTKEGFADMIADLCSRLAYMSGPNLAALEEQVAACPGGKDGDRVPIANKILAAAAEIQPPADSASPLIRAVFGHQVGRDALAGGWAPELLATLKRNRRWPNPYQIKDLRERAEVQIRQMRDCEQILARGDDLTEVQSVWRERRLAMLRKCQEIADMGVELGA